MARRSAMVRRMSEGLHDDDPGVQLLGRAVASADPDRLVLVHCGDLPGVRGRPARLVLGVRECDGARSRIVRADDDAAIAALSGMQHAAVWPRAHLGKDFSFACLALGARALGPGGKLWCSVRKAKGAESLGDFMVALLGNVDVVERERGYRLLCSVREDGFDATRAAAAIDLRHEIRDDALPGVVLHSAPGVFSRRGLDDGTRALIEHVAAWSDATGAAPRGVVDLCAGIGPLAIWAARRFPEAHVLAVESNMIATRLAADNATAAGVGARVHVALHDGMPTAPPSGSIAPGTVELALVNPPTHAAAEDLVALFAGLRPWMAPGGSAFAVVSRGGVSTRGLKAAGAAVDEHRAGAYTILHGRWA